MTAAPVFDLDDIQGNVLRGYRMPNARHFALAVENGGGARRFLASLISGREAEAPQVTTATDWKETRPSYCLNVGLTWPGLRAVGVPDSILTNFPAVFQQGSTANAAVLGDAGPSDPKTWVMGGPANRPVHIVVSLYASDHPSPTLDRWTTHLRALFARDGLAEVWSQEVTALPNGHVHFGFKDGIGQPRIEGVPWKQPADMQPAAKPGDFLLGKDYINQYQGNYLGDLPPEIGDNATYAALRVLRQDVVAFDRFITRAGRRYNMSPELVAAKLMGRWRNGIPLTLSPDDPDPPGRAIERRHLDDFDYAPTPEHPTYFDDSAGIRCPIGSHIRRLNPRSGVVMGKPYSRRIIRRGMPYGPAFDPRSPDGIERGLIGYFICGDLGGQFEFIQSMWMNADLSTAGLRGTREPLIGAQPDEGGRFVMRTNDNRDPIVFDDLPRFVDTRGSAYVLLPGIGGLRFLAGI